MMPDLGKYAAEVLAAYGVTLVLIVALVMLSLGQSARTRAALREIEEAQKARGEAPPAGTPAAPRQEATQDG